MHYSGLVFRGLLSTALLLIASPTVPAQTADVTTVSAVSNGPVVAPDSLATTWGASFTTETAAAESVPLPTNLGGVGISVTGVDSMQAQASLYLASPEQINFLVPEQTALGLGAVTVMANGANRVGDVLVSNVAPALITVNSMGTGTAAGQVVRVGGSGTPVVDQTVDSILVGEQNTAAYLMLYGTGIRGHSANPVQAMIHQTKVPVLYAGAQSEYPGLDQINVGPLPASLAGSGTVDLELFVDGVPANVVTVTFQ